MHGINNIRLISKFGWCAETAGVANHRTYPTLAG